MKIKHVLIDLKEDSFYNYVGECLFLNDVIKYQDKDINYEFKIKDNKVFFKKEDSFSKLNLVFSLNKLLVGAYFIKELNNLIKVRVFTKKLDITDKSIDINYELHIGEDIKEFSFNILLSSK